MRSGSLTTFPVDPKHMQVAANHFHVNVHLFDMSSITSGFSYHYPPAPTVYEKKHVFSSRRWPLPLYYQHHSNPPQLQASQTYQVL